MTDIEYYKAVLNAMPDPKKIVKRDLYEETERRLKESRKDLCFKCEERLGRFRFKYSYQIDSDYSAIGHIEIKLCRQCCETLE